MTVKAPRSSPLRSGYSNVAKRCGSCSIPKTNRLPDIMGSSGWSPAHDLRRRLFEGRLTIGEIAQAEDLIPSYVTRLVRLTFLAPDITASILSGRHDPDLTVSRLIADTRFPLDWSDQRRSFASA